MRRASGALLALAMIAGCGGESSSERIRKAANATATPLADTRPDDDGKDGKVPLELYLLRGEKLCQTATLRMNARLAPLHAEYRAKPTLAREMRLSAAAAESAAPLLAEVAELPLPEGHEAEARRMNRLGAATIRYLRRGVKEYEAGDLRAAERAFRVNRTAAGAFNEAAGKLGFEACVVGEIHPGR
jgi:hypothetical protein